jgi:hypothetical protein
MLWARVEVFAPNGLDLVAHVNWDQRTREAVSRLSDTHWRRVQRARRWLKLVSWAWLILSLVAGAWLIGGADGIREEILTDAAKMRAEAAEIRLAVESRRCEAFPEWCKDHTSVFYQRTQAKGRR